MSAAAVRCPGSGTPGWHSGKSSAPCGHCARSFDLNARGNFPAHRTDPTVLAARQSLAAFQR